MLRIIKALALASLPVFFSANTFADERGDVRAQLEPKGYLYGIGLGLSQEIYKGYNRRVIPLPILGYRGEKLSVYGPFVSYELLELGDVELEVQASPRFQGFDESDSDIFLGMEERDFSMDLGAYLKYERDNWKLSVGFLRDIFNKSDGLELKAKIAKAYKFGPIFFEPNLSISHLDKNHVDYYYGVRDFEVTQSRALYQGDSAINQSIGFSVSTPIFFGGFTQLAIDYTMFDSSITDSPLVERDNNLSMRLLFSKFF
ncbi:MipA/OmpV family protein [Pseudoalteromonas phenolica]|uniref:MipA/OmpV family protein n=1 Tax=Pseudoalteromonas phenolica TaxID=161398 RepID=UPI00384D2681